MRAGSIQAPEPNRIAEHAQLPRGWWGRAAISCDEVAAHQRHRLHRAMIELVATQGYAATSVVKVFTRAGVSSRTFYEHYSSKEECFLAAYDSFVDIAIERAADAYTREADPHQGLCRAFEQLLNEVVEDPIGVRFALSSALGAGTAALKRMERTRTTFERMITATYAAGPDGTRLPPIIVKGIVCGIEGIVRRRLAGRLGELPALAEELLAWLSSYRSDAVLRLPDISAANVSRLPLRARHRAAPVSDDLLRVPRTTAELLARVGYERLTLGQIADSTGVPERALTERYGDMEGCFAAALNLLALEVLKCTRTASSHSNDPLAAVQCGVTALLRQIACDPVLVRVAFVEVFVVGPEAIKHREGLLSKFGDLLVDRLPKAQRPSGVAMEATVSAIWGIIHQTVTSGSAQLLPALADHATYLALAPFVGAEEAADAVCGNEQDFG
jgi:AcrR family transcriptional regulator